VKFFDRPAQLLNRKFWPPPRVIHHEFPRAPENLMVYRKGRPYRESCVPRGRLNVDPSKPRVAKKFSVREASERDPTGQAPRLLLRFLRQRAPMSRKDFFQCRLHTCRYIPMLLFEWFSLFARWPQTLFQIRGKEPAEHWRLICFSPSHIGT